LFEETGDREMIEPGTTRARQPRRRRPLAAIAVVASLVLAPTADAADPSPFVTDGPIYAITSLGDTTYIGGAFSHVARRSGSGAVLQASDGSRDTAFPEFAGGEVDAVAAAPDGGWYVGGDYTSVGGYPIAGLAHIAHDGTVDTTFHPNPRNTDGTVGAVRAIAVGPAASADAGTVYVGGSFQKIGGRPDAFLAALDSGGKVSTDWSDTPQPNDAVYALAVLPVNIAVTINKVTTERSQSVVFAGGDFAAGSAAPPQISSSLLAAQWGQGAEDNGGNRVDGADTGWRPSTGMNVRGIVLGPPVQANPASATDAVVYAAGETYPRLAAFRFHVGPDGKGVAASQYGWSPSPDQPVRALARSGSTLYAGGDFTTVTGGARNHIAAFPAITDPTCSSCPSGSALGWNPGADGPVRALAAQGSTIYAGGDFTQTASQPLAHLAAIDSSGAATGWAPQPAGGTVDALVPNSDGSEVFAGGSFTGLSAAARNNLAAFDSSGNLTDWQPSTNDGVHALAAQGTTIYAGGRFTAPLSRLAAFDQSGNLVPGFNPSPDNSVLALSATSDALYVGGAFSQIGGASLANLAAVDLATGAVLPSWSGQADGNVYALDASCSTVYAGGAFTSIGGQPRRNIAAVDPVGGAATAWDPRSNGTVRAVRRFGPVVYAGGDFGQIGTAPRSGIAALDPATATATDWNPGSVGTYSVRALAVNATTVYAGGIFGTIGDAPRSDMAALDPTTGQATAWNPGADGTVYALSESAGTLHAGGSFTNLGTLTQEGFGAFVTGTPPEATSTACTPPPPAPVPAPPEPAVSAPPPPVLGWFWLTHPRFRAGARATAVAASGRHGRRHSGKRPPVSTTFRYLLSSAAGVTLTIERSQTGYVKVTRQTGPAGSQTSSRCVPAKRVPRHKRPCRIHRVVGRLHRSGAAGSNSIPFSGRIGTRPLHPGKYVAIIVATDAAGQRSQPLTLTFQVMR
jgi:hypothetical protein